MWLDLFLEKKPLEFFGAFFVEGFDHVLAWNEMWKAHATGTAVHSDTDCLRWYGRWHYMPERTPRIFDIYRGFRKWGYPICGGFSIVNYRFGGTTICGNLWKPSCTQVIYHHDIPWWAISSLLVVKNPFLNKRSAMWKPKMNRSRATKTRGWVGMIMTLGTGWRNWVRCPKLLTEIPLTRPDWWFTIDT